MGLYGQRLMVSFLDTLNTYSHTRRTGRAIGPEYNRRLPKAPLPAFFVRLCFGRPYPFPFGGISCGIPWKNRSGYILFGIACIYQFAYKPFGNFYDTALPLLILASLCSRLVSEEWLRRSFYKPSFSRIFHRRSGMLCTFRFGYTFWRSPSYKPDVSRIAETPFFWPYIHPFAVRAFRIPYSDYENRQGDSCVYKSIRRFLAYRYYNLSISLSQTLVHPKIKTPRRFFGCRNANHAQPEPTGRDLIIPAIELFATVRCA